ncbi:hypothetical protein AVEN_256427-1 [Araneus ventricosus]|uniref:Tc1-like transposase DDE domain-containing protein n=1 Tax=Araneus ventricosus TaxID=182803 RepID=A0A4Y2K1F4_ARAVE|nr:hypothetical protein AVEN_256427-1 [Araneus ventricosus]
MKQLLNLHFGNDRIIVAISQAWPPRSPDLNPCDFWLWSYVKDVVYGGPIANLAELKNRITQHIHNITIETLRSVVEHAVLRFQLIGENGGQHIEHFLTKSKLTTLTCLMVSSVFAFSTVLNIEHHTTQRTFEPRLDDGSWMEWGLEPAILRSRSQDSATRPPQPLTE